MRTQFIMTLAMVAAMAAPSGADRELGAQAPVKKATVPKKALPSEAPPQRAATPVKQSLLLPDGTQLSVTTKDEVSSQYAKEGDTVSFIVFKAVVVNNYVVIAEGTPVRAIVTESKGAGRFGKGGKLRVKVESTTSIDGQVVPLRASQGNEGDSNMKSTVALTVLLGPIGLLRKGDDVVMKPGTEIKVFTDDDVKVVLP